jgi:NAD(P)-dependent dehydrogenase (short-subunit alcohol dehydrogenase family)
MNLENRLVFITGAGSGIGRATALLLAEHGCRMAISDINEAALKDLADQLGDRLAFSAMLDVSNQDAFAAVSRNLINEVSLPDIVVNNAGVGMAGSFVDTSLEDWNWLLNINLKGVIHGCHFFAQPMSERGSGHIVNVASGLGLVAAPGASAYSASKFAVVGLSESLRVELASTGVGVSAICPGIVNTGITSSMRVTTGDEQQVRESSRRFYSRRNYGPEGVSRAIVKAITRNRGLVPVCPETHATFLLKRLFPSTAASAIGYFTRKATSTE